VRRHSFPLPRGAVNPFLSREAPSRRRSAGDPNPASPDSPPNARDCPVGLVRRGPNAAIYYRRRRWGRLGTLREMGATGPRSLREARGSGALLPLAQPLSPRRDPGRARTRALVRAMRPASSPPYSAPL
jgi:hypothetical protein